MHEVILQASSADTLEAAVKETVSDEECSES